MYKCAFGVVVIVKVGRSWTSTLSGSAVAYTIDLIGYAHLPNFSIVRYARQIHNTLFWKGEIYENWK